MATVNEKMTAIADSIRSKTGGTEKLNLDQMASAVGEVYEAGYAKGQAEGGDTTAAYDEGFEAGKKAEYDEFWDSVLPINYANQQSTFAGPSWNDKTFYPNKDIVFNIGRGDYLFFCNAVTNIKQRLAECGVKMDTSKVTNIYNSFTYATTSELPEISAVNAISLYGAFANATKLVTIDKIILKDDGSQKFQVTFNDCKALENVTFEGVIGQNGLNLQWSTKLSKESITSIINALSTTTSGLTVTLSKTAVDNAFETSEGAADGRTSDEWLTLAGTKDNWTIDLA